MAPVPDLIAVARTTSDLLPYLVVVGLGFLIGAWGQSAKVPVAVIIGLVMIVIGVGAFIAHNNSGGSGIPGIPGV